MEKIANGFPLKIVQTASFKINSSCSLKLRKKLGENEPEYIKF